MKYLRFITLVIVVLLASSYVGCGGKGLRWNYDGVEHSFSWGEGR